MVSTLVHGLRLEEGIATHRRGDVPHDEQLPRAVDDPDNPLGFIGAGTPADPARHGRGLLWVGFTYSTYHITHGLFGV